MKKMLMIHFCYWKLFGVLAVWVTKNKTVNLHFGLLLTLKIFFQLKSTQEMPVELVIMSCSSDSWKFPENSHSPICYCTKWTKGAFIITLVGGWAKMWVVTKFLVACKGGQKSFWAIKRRVIKLWPKCQMTKVFWTYILHFFNVFVPNKFFCGPVYVTRMHVKILCLEYFDVIKRNEGFLF